MALLTSKDWKPRTVHPRDHVADFKPGILDAHGHAVLGARPGKRQQVPARLEYAQALGPNFHARHVVVISFYRCFLVFQPLILETPDSALFLFDGYSNFRELLRADCNSVTLIPSTPAAPLLRYTCK